VVLEPTGSGEVLLARLPGVGAEPAEALMLLMP
jgi:hypothetical protein